MVKISFQQLPRVEPPDQYLKHALAKADKRVSKLSVKGTPIDKRKKREVERIIMIRDELLKVLQRFITRWPSIDDLPEFYHKLIDTALDENRLKKALGSLRFAQETIKSLSKEYIQKIKRQIDDDSTRRIFGQYLGRVSSVLKQVGTNLKYLEQARYASRAFPSLDVDLFTVALAGLPNVGKSTLLAKLTTSKPEIKNYAFTTKGLNVGSFEYRFSEIQCIDTPGALGRTQENTIEQLATITRQYVAKLVVYVFDATEPYPMAQQQKLLEQMRKEGHDIILYLSKTDILPKAKVAEMKQAWPGILTTPAQVKKAICVAFKEWE